MAASLRALSWRYPDGLSCTDVGSWAEATEMPWGFGQRCCLTLPKWLVAVWGPPAASCTMRLVSPSTASFCPVGLPKYAFPHPFSTQRSLLSSGGTRASSLPVRGQSRLNRGVFLPSSLEHPECSAHAALPDNGPRPSGGVEGRRDGGKRGGSRWPFLNRWMGPSCRAVFAGRRDARSERAGLAGKSVPSMGWFRNIGFAGSVNFHWCMAINLGLHHTSLCLAVWPYLILPEATCPL